MSASPLSPAELTQRLRTRALELGFARAAACPAVEPPGWQRFRDWLEAGYAGEMRYLADRRDAYGHPRHVLDGAQSLLMLAFPYRTSEPNPAADGRGRVARYAWNADYHELIHDRLHRLADAYRAWVPGGRARGVVDTAPLLEREFAQLAGLGWIGKNTLLLSRELGSWFFLAALLVDGPLECDTPPVADHCGTCTACLDACPTGAFVAPYQLDSRRCISYLTIELAAPIPGELRPGLGNWVFGCDVCQEVCPWNRKAPTSSVAELEPAADRDPLALAELFWLDEAGFRQRFRHTPLWRPKRRGLLRSAAVVLGNQRSRQAAPALRRGLDDPEPLVRGACAWALGQLAPWPDPRAWLHERLASEPDPVVRGELQAALTGFGD